MKLLVLDDYEGEIAGSPSMSVLRGIADVTILNRPLGAEDRSLLEACHVLLALRERTKLDERFFERCPNLELVLQTGGHAYHLDEASATKRGIVVAFGRGVTTPMIVVPELVFALLLGLVRQIYPLATAMKAGGWPETIGRSSDSIGSPDSIGPSDSIGSSDSIGRSLHGQVIGLLGYGRHGRPVARLAEAFGMKVIAWDRDESAPPPDEFGVERLPLSALLAASDVLSIHLRLSDESRGLLNANRFAQMKDGALLINTSRGAIVDESALVDALRTGKLSGAGLDVFAAEPLASDHPLRSLPNVLLTPHVGWKVRSVFHEFAQIAAAQLEAWLAKDLAAADILNPDALLVDRARRGGVRLP